MRLWKSKHRFTRVAMFLLVAAFCMGESGVDVFGPEVRRIGGRLSAFNKQLADTITLLSNSLRAGSSFLQSIELVSRETPDPMGEEMGRVVREVNLGLGMEEALSNLVRRIRSDDLDLMVTAIGVQQQVGGNLAEILDTIAFTIR